MSGSSPSRPVLTAVTGHDWEAGLLAALDRAGVPVARRCVDLADLLAAASTGVARAALVASDLRGLDRDTLGRLAAAGLAVVGVHGPEDGAAGERLRGLGLAFATSADAGERALVATISAALAAPVPLEGAVGYSRPTAPVGLDPSALRPGAPDGRGAPPGRLVAVWGPPGAPGRTTVATNMAGGLARSGTATLLADADVYGGVLAQVLGLLDEAPGLAAAARLANNGALDVTALAKVAPEVMPGLRVLTGIPRADRWPELRPAALAQVWVTARQLAAVTVVDCAFCLEQDEELSFDTAAPRRNGATLLTLAAADDVLAVGSADPVGVQRLVRGLAALRDAVPGVVPRVVLNRVRRSAVGGDPRRELREALERYAGVRDLTFVPEDRPALDAAVLRGRLLAEVSPQSPVQVALDALAGSLSGGAVTRPARRPPRRLLRRRR